MAHAWDGRHAGRSVSLVKTTGRGTDFVEDGGEGYWTDAHATTHGPLALVACGSPVGSGLAASQCRSSESVLRNDQNTPLAATPVCTRIGRRDGGDTGRGGRALACNSRRGPGFTGHAMWRSLLEQRPADTVAARAGTRMLLQSSSRVEEEGLPTRCPSSRPVWRSAAVVEVARREAQWQLLAVVACIVLGHVHGRSHPRQWRSLDHEHPTTQAPRTASAGEVLAGRREGRGGRHGGRGALHGGRGGALHEGLHEDRYEGRHGGRHGGLHEGLHAGLHAGHGGRCVGLGGRVDRASRGAARGVGGCACRAGLGAGAWHRACREGEGSIHAVVGVVERGRREVEEGYRAHRGVVAMAAVEEPGHSMEALPRDGLGGQEDHSSPHRRWVVAL